MRARPLSSTLPVPLPVLDEEDDDADAAAVPLLLLATWVVVWVLLAIPVLVPAHEPAPPRVLVWVHGGVHGSWSELMWPFVREAVERGYVIIAPDYRGRGSSTT